ncbi:hypothetical protein SU48_04045 [Deinococcus puniceus]|uniref:Uncharacterized protein n=1 Tax=Deinococcus puniceus TaxID=1182568 RepID=A0A172T802_9DEIO|nr:hypothetical protein SU48_04045 [Deinococcus puniceus]
MLSPVSTARTVRRYDPTPISFPLQSSLAAAARDAKSDPLPAECPKRPPPPPALWPKPPQTSWAFPSGQRPARTAECRRTRRK